MESPALVRSEADILEEGAALAAAAARVRLPPLPVRQVRGGGLAALEFPTRAAPPRGYPLAARCAPHDRERLERVSWLEAYFPEAFDHAALVILGCQVLESELTRLLAEPARRLGAPLLAAAEGRVTPAQREALGKWLAGRLPTTLGTIELVLHALRQGLAGPVPEVAAFVAAGFAPRYAELLAANAFGRSLGRLRNDYRNPAAHGLREIARPEYRRFCALAVGSETFGGWREGGPRPDPPAPDEGLLHHHLAHRAPDSASLDGPGDAAGGPPPLFRLRTPAEQDLRLHLAVLHAGAPAAVRGVRLTPAGGPAAFRIGESLRFAVEVSAPCRVALLDWSTGGRGAVLFPNRWRTDPGVAACVLHLPDPRAPECDFPVEGPPGTESLLALATRQPLAFPLLPGGPGAVMRALSAEDCAALERALAALPPGAWAADPCAFEVRP
jgi:hypothetical protein